MNDLERVLANLARLLRGDDEPAVRPATDQPATSPRAVAPPPEWTAERSAVPERRPGG